MGACPNCGAAILEKKNSKGMVNFKCTDQFAKGCRSNGYLRHERNEKTQTGPTEGQEGHPAPEITPQPKPATESKPARKRVERKKREPNGKREPVARDDKPRGRFFFDLD